MNNAQIEVGQIWQQLAIINPDEKPGQEKMSLLILGTDDKIIRTIQISEADFKKQYQPVEGREHYWKSQVRITSVDASKIWFSKLKTNGDSVIDNVSYSKKEFSQHFRPKESESEAAE